jgi:N4-gp56 family major capsid protein
MANTFFSALDPLTVKLWSRIIHRDAVKTTLYGKLMGTAATSIVQRRDDLKKSRGDRIRFPIRLLSDDTGVQDSETLEGREEGLEFRDFDLLLGEKRKATKVELNLSEQRTMVDVREEAAEQVREWCEDYLDTTFMEYLTGRGQGPGGASKYHPSGALGGNTINTFAADRQVFGGTATSLATLVAGSTMSARVIDKCIDMAKLATPMMRKANFNGRKAYVCILHPWQISALRTDAATAGWFDLNKAVTQGGGSSPIMEEALAVYRDVIILESTRVPTFLAGAGNDVPAATGVFLGAQAAVTGHGSGTNDKGVLRMTEKLTDYDKYHGLAVTLIWGMQRTRFAGQSDYAAIAINTAAAPIA